MMRRLHRHRKRDKSTWMIKYWRHCLSWQYFAINLFDFLIAPWMFIYLNADKATIVQWQPLTLQGGGLYHISMMAILGISSYSRTQEKIEMMRDKAYGADVVKAELDETYGSEINSAIDNEPPDPIPKEYKE